MKIINVYDKDELRAGDIYSGPYQYFDWPLEIKAMTCRVLDDVPFDDENIFFIFGGGGMLHIPFPGYDQGRFLLLERFHKIANRVALWGLGHNVHGAKKIEYPDYINDFIAVGVRDWNCGLRYVPCASCMHEVFRKSYEIKDEVRAYRRDDPFDWWPFPYDDYPILKDAEGNPLERITEFIGGAKIVITNSYHGAYWSMLLGREVIIHKPFASKFFGLTDFYEVVDGNIVIPVHADFYKRCVNANKDFYTYVLGQI